MKKEREANIRFRRTASLMLSLLMTSACSSFQVIRIDPRDPNIESLVGKSIDIDNDPNKPVFAMTVQSTEGSHATGIVWSTGRSKTVDLAQAYRVRLSKPEDFRTFVVLALMIAGTIAAYTAAENS